MPVRLPRRSLGLRLSIMAIMAMPLLAFAFAPTPPAPSSLHLHLRASTPADGATLDRSPSEIRLVFSAKVALASLHLQDATGHRMALGKAQLSVSPRVVLGQGPDSVIHNAGIVVAAVSQPLHAGRYELTWKAVGSDGHAVQNHFGFTVGRAAPPGR